MNNKFEKYLKQQILLSLMKFEFSDYSININEDIIEDLSDYIYDNVIEIIKNSSVRFTDELIPGVKNVQCTQCNSTIGKWISSDGSNSFELENIDIIKDGRKILPL